MLDVVKRRSRCHRYRNTWAGKGKQSDGPSPCGPGHPGVRQAPTPCSRVLTIASNGRSSRVSRRAQACRSQPWSSASGAGSGRSADNQRWFEDGAGGTDLVILGTLMDQLQAASANLPTVLANGGEIELPQAGQIDVVEVHPDQDPGRSPRTGRGRVSNRWKVRAPEFTSAGHGHGDRHRLPGPGTAAAESDLAGLLPG